jgi:predicted ATPase/DNA-binding XRE family transcriptional regulator
LGRPQLMTAADPRWAFGAQLKRQRLSAGLTHESLAERAGLSPRTISDLERGVSRRPHRDTLELLIRALDLSAAERSALESAAWASAMGPVDLTTSGREAGSVPVHLTSFIGREQERRVARERLRRDGARLLTLTGAGGSGKSRLATRIASDLLPEFRDGARYVELAPVAQADDVLPAIARALGVARPEAASVRLADTIAAVCDRQQLLVVDNFEHLLKSAPLISQLLQGCPGLVILVTSRASLQLSGEHEMAVAPLAVPPANPELTTEAIAEYASVRLFVDRASSINQAFVLSGHNASAVAAICARLDGLPLALELAAARTKMLSARALLERLDSTASGSALRLLTRTARDVPPRQRTLRDTMLWSYNLLEPAEQRLLRKLSIFAGGCTLSAAEVVCGWDPSDTGLETDSASEVFDGLTSLLDKSLVYLHEGPDGEQRFMLLETVREFGLDELRANGELETVARAHATYYLQLIEATGALLFAGAPKQRRSAAEQHNLHDALRWLLHHG